MTPTRRGFLTGAVALIAAPAIVRAASLMPVRALVEPRVIGPIIGQWEDVRFYSRSIPDLLADCEPLIEGKAVTYAPKFKYIDVLAGDDVMRAIQAKGIVPRRVMSRAQLMAQFPRR